MTLSTDRKEELYRIIDHLHDVSLWGDLTLNEQKQLEEAETELASIVAKEKTMKELEAKETRTRVKRAQYRGKNYERRVAKLIKGVVVGRSKAVPIAGRFIQINCQKPPDVVNDWLSVECKYWRELPKNITKIMSQAMANCPREQGLTPIAWIGDREAKTNYVIMTERDFLDLHIGG